MAPPAAAAPWTTPGFCNHPQVRWEYRVHEQILPAVIRLGGAIRPTEVVIHHLGYRDAVCLDGRGRYPDDLELLFAEGLVRRDLGDLRGAEACLVRLLQHDPCHGAAQFHLARLRAAAAPLRG
jgi:hypothetical protein